jgi:hypothetical protein
MEVESLKKIFEHHNNANEFSYEGNCHKCGCHTKVKITKTSGGYGLQGGVLFEQLSRNILILCSECIKKNGNQIYDLHHPSSQETN